MLESKLRTGTSKTKKMQICLDEVALFWMSQWTACSPAWRILYHVTASCKGPIGVSKTIPRPVSFKHRIFIGACVPHLVRVSSTPHSRPQSRSALTMSFAKGKRSGVENEAHSILRRHNKLFIATWPLGDFVIYRM